MEANNDSAIQFELLAEKRQKQAEQDRIDAERYRKIERNAMTTGQWLTVEEFRKELDGAEDLPEVK